MQFYDVAVIGGGAAGLACAVSLKNLNKNISVLIVDSCDRLGKKIAATGNGQGNLSNAEMTLSHYHGSGANRCLKGGVNPLSLFDFLCVKDKLGRIYPAGKQASAISDCLIRKAEKCGVDKLLSTTVTGLEKGFILKLSDGGEVKAKYVVLAAGGCAQKQFGTNGGGFALAKSIGHTITPLYPSLVQLKCAESDLKQLKGIRAECRVTAWLGGEKICSTVGDVIFTDYGVSGNAIFYISAYCAGKKGVTLSLEFLPEVSAEEIEADVRRKLKSDYPTSELLAGTLHNSVGRAVIKRSGSDPHKIAQTVKDFKLSVTGSLGWDYAQVTKGGVRAEEVDDSLQSRLVENLYFAGEILDVDGDCGGYNLHWAFESGMRVAQSIAEKFR